MVYEKCPNWKGGELIYDEVIDRWNDSVGGEITSGNLARYEKEAQRKGEDVRIIYQ